jgi:hypothetical protein
VSNEDVSDSAAAEDVKTSKSLPYKLEYDENANQMTLVEIKNDARKLSAGEVAGLLNARYQAVKLDLLKSSGDTIFLQIKNATKLTREMGSAGAQAYLAEVTFSFTELEGIKVVDLLFEEGDHAMPGSYKREDFSEFKVVEQK